MSEHLDRWQRTCRHFTGIQHDTCDAGVNYRTIRDVSGPGMAKWHCTDPDSPTKCPLFSAYTVQEAEQMEREIEESITSFLTKLNSGICPECDKSVEPRRQVGRCVYGACG